MTGVINLILFSPLIVILIDNTLCANSAHTIHKIFYILYVHLLVYIINYSGVRDVKLTLRSLTLYIYGAPILDVSRSHTTTQHSR